jgi:hypothetical protein
MTLLKEILSESSKKIVSFGIMDNGLDDFKNRLKDTNVQFVKYEKEKNGSGQMFISGLEKDLIEWLDDNELDSSDI